MLKLDFDYLPKTCCDLAHSTTMSKHAAMDVLQAQFDLVLPFDQLVLLEPCSTKGHLNFAAKETINCVKTSIFANWIMIVMFIYTRIAQINNWKLLFTNFKASLAIFSKEFCKISFHWYILRPNDFMT